MDPHSNPQPFDASPTQVPSVAVVAVDLHAARARHARLARKMGSSGYGLFLGLSLCLIALGAICLFVPLPRVAYLSFAAALLSFMPAAWYKLELKPLPIRGTSLTDQLSPDILTLLKPGMTLTPQTTWSAMKKHWQFIFYANHFLLSSDTIEGCLSSIDYDMSRVWAEAAHLARATDSPVIEPGHLAGALLVTAPDFTSLLSRMKLASGDAEAVAMWLGRALDSLRAEKPYFGGVGRDWANGFTPKLNQFGFNISLSIEQHGSHFGWLTQSPGVTAIKSAFAQGTSTVGLIGEPGVGKTSHIYALAQFCWRKRTTAIWNTSRSSPLTRQRSWPVPNIRVNSKKLSCRCCWKPSTPATSCYSWTMPSCSSVVAPARLI